MDLHRVAWAGVLLGAWVFSACTQDDSDANDPSTERPTPGAPSSNNPQGPVAGDPVEGGPADGDPEVPGPSQTPAPTPGDPGPNSSQVPSTGSTPSPTSTEPSAPNVPHAVESGPATACITYMETACARYLQCSINTTCTTISHLCPDVLFAEGSTRSVQDVLDCADVWRTFDCEALQQGLYPDCVRPGTRAIGEACAFHGQCASTECSRLEAGECGECVTMVQTAPQGPPGPVLVPLPSLNPGDPCTGGNQCPAGHHCAREGDARYCKPYPELGEDCSDARHCVGGSYCELEGLVCRAMPVVGAACGVDGWTGTAGWCDSGLVCRRQSERVGTCVPIPEVGDPCVFYADESTTTIESTVCKYPATCDLELDPPTCQPPIRTLAPGDACGAGRDACHPASTCIGGICQPLESQGLFRTWCDDR